MAELEQQVDDQLNNIEKLLTEKKELLKQLDELKQDLGQANLNEARISRVEQQLAEAKEAGDKAQASITTMLEEKKKLAKDMQSLREELDNATNEKAKALKAKKNLEAELEDANVSINSMRSEIASLTAKQKSFDKQLAEEKTRYEALSSERDTLQSQV